MLRARARARARAQRSGTRTRSLCCAAQNIGGWASRPIASNEIARHAEHDLQRGRGASEECVTTQSGVTRGRRECGTAHKKIQRFVATTHGDGAP